MIAHILIPPLYGLAVMFGALGVTGIIRTVLLDLKQQVDTSFPLNAAISLGLGALCVTTAQTIAAIVGGSTGCLQSG